MTDREEIVKGLEIQLDDLQKYADEDEILTITQEQAKQIISLLKKQKNEMNRILKIVWDVLHSGISVDTVADQDWVYELIRNKANPLY